MNNAFPPLLLIQPQIIKRRQERPRRAPLPPEIMARRKEIATRLKEQMVPISQHLKAITEEARKAMFFKLEHERPISLQGTDLKAVSESSGRFTLVVPRSNDLDKLIKKVEEFEQGEVKEGHIPYEDLVALKSITEGHPKDRLSQALFEHYEELIRQDWIICEIEIISLATGRAQQRRELENIRGALDQVFSSGTLGNFFEQEEIKGTCRAVIRCNGGLFKKLVEEQFWRTKIFWFDARPEFQTFSTIFDTFNVQQLGLFKGPDERAPIVCVVDSGVTAGNPFLEPVTREDLFRSFLKHAPDNPYDEHGHGSGVASLASYYSLNINQGAINEGKIWIAAARVLDAHNQTDERLFSKVLAEVVDTFLPHGIRIFNLSVNIVNRKWNIEARRTVPRRSWIARTIDRLSREKDIVFILSAGNSSREQIKEHLQIGKPYPDYFADEESCILDPGQAALALTVGAIAPGTLAVGRVGTATAIAEVNQPAPFTRCGPGICREIKPELVELGGNYFLDSESQIVRPNPGSSVLMASHQRSPAITYEVGTSFAAPRVAYKSALILKDLQAMGLKHISAPLLKAFIVNSAVYRGVDNSEEENEVNRFKKSMEAVRPKHWLNVLGYGMPDDNRATYCDRHSVLLFFQGELVPNNVAYFDIPVPVSLADSGNEKKRLTITVVHAPEVQRWGLEQYVGTIFKWKMFRGDIGREGIIKAMSIENEEGENEEKGKHEEAEKPNELKFNLGVNLRSRGTVQHDVHEWRTHRVQYSSNNYTLAVAAYEKWSRPHPAPVPYAIVVRLEDLKQSTEIYTEIRDLLVRIEV